MATHDESETGHGAANIHQLGKRLQQDANWSAEASRELLRLRFRQLRGLFDDAQTVADVHEAWGVVAAEINEQDALGVHVDAVKCSDQLTKLRKQWQESSTTQLHLMMAECFSKSPTVASQPGSSNFNRTMEEAMVTEAEEAKRRKTTMEAPPQTETPVAVEPVAVVMEVEAPFSPEPAPLSPQTTPTTPQSASSQSAEDEENQKQEQIMRLLEIRSQQLERLAKSHRELAHWTQKTMAAIVHRQNL